jgi:hypothetical protein
MAKYGQVVGAQAAQGRGEVEVCLRDNRGRSASSSAEADETTRELRGDRGWLLPSRFGRAAYTSL